jgi:dTDP-4-amino-4,6-dideoxygalactose transaminase
MPVHIAGQPADMDRIMEIASRNNLKVIEDAAQAWSARWHDKGVGAIGDIGEFSFQASKNLNAGEGGILLTNNAELAETARSCTNCGRGKGKGWYEHYILAGNYRMTEFQAALLLVQLTRFEGLEQKRRKNAEYLNEKLSQIDGIQTIHTDQRVTKRPYHIYIFKYLENKFCGIPREFFLKALEAEGIPCRPGYPFPLYENPLFQKIDFSSASCPVTERISKKEAVWLRQEMLLGTKEDMDNIVRAIEKIRENAEELRG